MDTNIEKSVVQIITEHKIITYSYPWQSSGKTTSTCTGFCIEVHKRKYILSNAHCVFNASSIRLRKRGHSNLFLAKLVFVAYECDLALLDIGEKESSEFWNDIPQLTIGNTPKKLSKVYVYGYPLGGYNISVTKGVVNRIQIINYSGVVQGIVIQVDAAINPGNSGGPAVDKLGNVIGVAFAGESGLSVQNMGYLIPPAIIRFFLQSVPAKEHPMPVFLDGLRDLEISTQSIDSETMRKFIKLPQKRTGVLITEISQLNVAASHIKKYDVLLEVDGFPIDNDETMKLHSLLEVYGESGHNLDEIIPFQNYIHLKTPGSRIELLVWRKGKEKKISFDIDIGHYKMPRFLYDVNPYYVVMGLIFLVTTFPLIREKYTNSEYVHHLIELAKNNQQSMKGEQIVILSGIFTTRFTEGFSSDNSILDTVNGVKITNLEHLVETVKKRVKSDEFLVFEFVNRSEKIILKSSEVKKYNGSVNSDLLGEGVPDFYI